MFSEDDLLPISALQHLAFCERQWGLIHLECLWDENQLTAQGRHLHEKTDSPETEVRADIRTARGLRLRSLRLGLSGIADVVEFHRSPEGMMLDGVDGLWQPLPVEYKRGRPKPDHCDEVQLCAQALCLEEMTKTTINVGMLYYGMPRRRYEVQIDSALRDITEGLCKHLHELTQAGKTPTARFEKKCKMCSLMNQCLPETLGKRIKARQYLEAIIAGADTEGAI